MIHIAKDGNGDFTSVQAALDTLSPDNREEVVLFIHKGIYEEQITVTVPHVTMIGEGESPSDTVLTYYLYAREILPDGMKRGTFRSYSCIIDTHDFKAENLTFQNSSGNANTAGQALAMYADGDRLHFVNCRFISGQDTLFTGPLPPKELQPNGFIGPKQFAPRINGRHLYEKCYIEGDIDFIFGSATAYFDECTFHSNEIGREVNGYVTAPSTPEGQEYGYVMNRCRFISDTCRPESVYLGRPWRNFAKTVLINCYMGSHIKPEGWHDWNKPEARDTMFFGEYGSYGPGGTMDMRPDWVKRLGEDELTKYTKEAVLGTEF